MSHPAVEQCLYVRSAHETRSHHGHDNPDSEDGDHRPLRNRCEAVRQFLAAVRTGDQQALFDVLDIGGELNTVASVDVVDGRITRMYAVRNPDKLERLDEEVTLSR